MFTTRGPICLHVNHARIAAASALAIALFAMTGACSSNAATPTMLTDAGRGGEDDAGSSKYDWSCLGKVTLPPPAGPSSNVTVTLSDTKSVPVPNLDVRACPDREDATCANGTTAKKTDSAGAVALEIPLGTAGFNGYFEAVEANDVTNLHFVPNAILKTITQHDRAEWRASEIKLLMDTVDVKIDPTRGNILVQTQDCKSKALPNNELALSPLAGGVSLTLDPMPAGVTRAYVILKPTTIVSVSATATADDFGGAGFINVPAGVYSVIGTLERTGERIGTQRLHVRAGAHSMVILAPTP